MTLSPKDINQIAALQIEVLRDSLVSRFGRRYAASYWRYVDHAAQEVAICIHATDGTVVAACALSFAPATLAKRLVIHTPLIIYTLRNILAPWLWAAIRDIVMLGGSAGAKLPANELQDVAEVVMLMTHPGHRRRGHARALLAEVEKLLADRGITHYRVRTSDKNTGAVEFYQDNGFCEAGYFNAHGAQFKKMIKKIAPPANPTTPSR